MPSAHCSCTTCDLRDSRQPGRTCGPHGVRIREVPALPAVPALRCHITPKISALKFKQIRNLGLKVHRHSQFPPTESLGWGCNSFQASNIQLVVLLAHNNDNKEERELILLCLHRHAVQHWGELTARHLRLRPSPASTGQAINVPPK